MPRKLSSDWVKVCTSGNTVDGRTISEQEIQDMADTYDLKEYTANIWYEHIRYFGNLGRVNEVKAEKDDKDRLCLFNKLAPSDELLHLNSRGQKLFTSVEIVPNFANSGKSYLGGTAVTDSPASIGTSELQFSRLGTDKHFVSAPEPIGDIQFENEPGWVGRLFSSLNKQDQTSQDEDVMSEKLLKQISEQLSGLENKYSDLDKKLSGLQGGIDSARGESTTDADDDQNQNKDEPVSMEAFNSLVGKIEDLGKQFSEALDTEVPSTKPGENTGGEEGRQVI